MEKETQLAEKKDLESQLVSYKPSVLIDLHLPPHFVVVVLLLFLDVFVVVFVVVVVHVLEYAPGSDELTGTEHVRGSVCGRAAESHAEQGDAQ